METIVGMQFNGEFMDRVGEPKKFSDQCCILVAHFSMVLFLSLLLFAFAYPKQL